STSLSAGSFPSPIAAHECSVLPPTLTAAIPVEAVTANFISFSLHHRMISRSRTDLPVPAEPVKNTLLPLWTIFRTCSCSGDN
ncbi:hypothetical protein BDW22DRAFT_1305332, partial [Trametopsis cervina]